MANTVIDVRVDEDLKFLASVAAVLSGDMRGKMVKAIENYVTVSMLAIKLQKENAELSEGVERLAELLQASADIQKLTNDFIERGLK